MVPPWLDWAIRLQAIAQNGLTYAENPFDRERYEAVRRLAAEVMAAGAGTTIEPVLDLFARETGYATPKVDVRGVVFREGRVLLVQEHSDGRWTLPGGWADVQETPTEAVEREVREESGYLTRATKLLAVYDRSRHPHEPPYPYHIYKLFIRCDLVGGEAAGSHETDAVGFFEEHALPELSISRVTASQIARLFEHYRQPNLPTDLD
ncbi:MAG: NUDIX hydrolase [Anaerolineae bacterium]